MDRRNIDFEVHVAGQPYCIFKDKIKAYTTDTDSTAGCKLLVYTNSQQRADGNLTSNINMLLSKEGNGGGTVRAFTGQTGIMEKKYLINLFAGHDTSTLCPLQGLTITKAGCRYISSKDCRLLFCEGLPVSLEDLAQIRGRSGRDGVHSSGPQDKSIFAMSMDHFTSLVHQIRKHDSKTEQDDNLSVSMSHEGFTGIRDPISS